MATSRPTNHISSLFYRDLYKDSFNIPNLLLKSYKQISLNEHELVVLLNLLQIYHKIGYLDINDIKEQFAMEEMEARAYIGSLISKDFIALKESNPDHYSLNGFFNHLYELWSIEKRNKPKKAVNGQALTATAISENNMAHGQLYRSFEQELGKSLSPLENEKIGHWLNQDNQSPELISEALKQAVLRSKLSFAYIDKILFNWRKENIKTLADLQNKKQANEQSPSQVQARPKSKAHERIADTWLNQD